MLEQITKKFTYPTWMMLDGNHRGIPYLHGYEVLNRLSRDELHHRQETNLRAIIRHAHASSVYYRDLFDRHGLNPESFSHEDFRRLPLLTKDDVRNNIDKLLSSAIRPAVRIPASTGGSTGTPMHFFRDRDCQYKRKGQELLFDRWMGYDIGKKIALFVAASHHDTVGNRIKYAIRNATFDRLLSFDPGHITEEYVSSFAARFNLYRPFMIKCFPNSLTAFTELALKLGIRPVSVQSISCTGENLYEQQKKLFTETYRGEVFEKYGTKECGVISSECREHDGQHVFTEGVLLEIIGDGGKPVEPGQIGRIVVTDLFNRATPLIRYDIGDMAIAGDGRPCGCGVMLPKIKKVIGRDRDILLDENGNPKPGYLFVEVINKYNLPGQYQIIQKDLTSLYIYIAAKNDKPDTEHLISSMKKIIGQSVKVRIEFVDSIPREPSGKYAYVKSEITKNT
jgi:phenylacetate-CoA ligase